MSSYQPDPTQALIAKADAATRQLVLAGPGTGKTQTVALRLIHLLRSGVGPGKILVLSFSRSAVRTLMRRLEMFESAEPVILSELQHISVRTFDSWAFRILRRMGHQPRELLSGAHDQTIAMLVSELRGGRRPELKKFLAEISHVIVDEFQDLGGIRGELVTELLSLIAPPETEGVGFTILGDEAQAIYGFSLRNADGVPASVLTSAELLRTLENLYAGTITTTVLNRNYRAVPKLASVAEALRNILRRDTTGEKKLEAMRSFLSRIPSLDEPLSPDYLTEVQEGSAAVLTRTNGEAIRVYERLLGTDETAPEVSVILRAGSRVHSVPAWIGSTLGRYEGATLTRSQFRKIYQHLYPDGAADKLEIPAVDNAWEILSHAADAGRGASSVTMAKLQERMEWPDSFPDDSGIPQGSIQIMTVHQSKGMEFGSVTVLQHEDRDGELSPEEALEEASVIFVALTRAGSVLKRIPIEDKLYPLSLKTFREHTRRWESWRGDRINLEIGIAGDVSSTSFVDLRVHDSEEAVAELQDFLAKNRPNLRGRKVVLSKMLLPGSDRKFIYGIYLQENDAAGRLLGLTTEDFTLDLLDRYWSKYHSLPSNIWNLRIMDVVTMTLRGDDVTGLAEKYGRSRIWLGVSIYGAGFFKMFRRNT